MNSNLVWENIFRSRITWGRYPPEEVVRFFAKNYYAAKNRENIKVLDLGCGPGAGTSWYLAREGFSLYGIDGSKEAIKQSRQRFKKEHLRGNFKVGQAQILPWPDNYFDCVVDNVCLQHNSQKDTILIINEIYRVLKPGGRHFSLTIGKGTYGEGSGEKIDATTYRELVIGPFSKMGPTRFATKESLKKLYSCFSKLEIGRSCRSIGDSENEIKYWVLSCQK